MAVLSVLEHLREGHQARYLAEQSAIQDLAWEAASRVNQRAVRVYFNEHVMHPETLALLKKAQDPSRRDEARRGLYDRLRDINEQMQQDGFRQLHFHLPNGESFLRFHQPDAYGDNLFGVRHSIEVANKQLRSVYGFEAGRIYSGFRNVFPVITPSGEHLGSVELSMPFEVVRKEIAALLGEWEFLFVVSAAQQEAVLFERQKSLYAPWAVHEGFWVEDPNRVLPDAPKALSIEAGCMLSGAAGHAGLRRLIDQGRSGAVAIKTPNGYALLALTPTFDTQDRLSGYLVGMRGSEEPARLDESVHFGRWLSAFLIALLAVVSWRLRQNRKRLEQTKESLSRALDSEKQFIASMSHEMRTPLNAILGYQELLLELPLSSQALDFAQKANRSSQHLFALINDVLDLSKIEANQLDLASEPLDLPLLMQECAEIAEPGLRTGVALAFDCKRLDCVPLGDAMRLKQIFINLLGNAAKFTQAGQIDFLARTVLQEEKSVTIAFSVADTGTGIAPSRLGEIFKPFRRAHDGRYEGTGLGLYLSSLLAARMGGRLEVASKPGEGSVFTLTLPFACRALKAAPIVADYSRFLVLMVEDMPLSAELAKALFERFFGIDLQIAATAEEAVSRVAREPFDLVFTDIQLPGTSGFEVAAQLKMQHPGLPIVAISAGASAEDAKRAKAAGLADYLTKPIQKEQVAAVLARVLGTKEP